MEPDIYPVELVRTEVVIENGRMARVIDLFRVTDGPQAGAVLRFTSAEGTCTVDSPPEDPS